MKIVILTGDLDTLQLVDDGKVAVETPKKGISETIVYDRKAVRERFSLNPEQLPDYKDWRAILRQYSGRAGNWAKDR